MHCTISTPWFMLQINTCTHVHVHKSRLIALNLLPISLWMELQDVLLFIKLVQFPPDNFSLLDYISFVSSSRSCRSSSNKIKSNNSRVPRLNSTRHFYMNRIVWIWNSLSPLDLDDSFVSLRKSLFTLYWNYFLSSYDIRNSCSWFRNCPCSNCISLHT